jgi:hypothetical protein
LKNQSHKNDLFLFSLIALAILALSSLPYWVGRASETDELLFRGIYFDEADYAVHISMMQAGSMGDGTYQMRFTDEEHRAAFLRMFYIALGHASRWTGLHVETTFHIARWIFGFIALSCIYQLFQKIFRSVSHARAAFLLGSCGAGAGWLQLILGAPLEPISPIDFWLIDAYVFFSVSLFPSFSFNLALMGLTLNLFLNYLETGKWQTVLWISLLAALSQTTNPIALATVDMAFAGAVLSLWWRNRKIESRHVLALLAIALAQLPLLSYNYLILNHDPVWSTFTFQNQTLSPPPIFYLWGFAPFWLFAPYGIILAFRERNSSMIAMAAWVFTGFVLVYLPVAIQRRFILGITIPLAALAIYGLGHLIKLTSFLLKRENLTFLTFALLASVSSIYLVLGTSQHIQTLPTEKYYPRDFENALAWLNENATPNDFVLGSIPSSQLTAQRTRLKVYVGHKMETIQFENKKSYMISFYKGTSPKNWLTQTRVQWVIYGPYEREISSSFSPSPDLKLIYKNKTVTIYKRYP